MSDFEYEANGHKYTEEQMIEVFAKLKIAQLMIERGTEMAREAENTIKFYWITNGVGDVSAEDN